MSRRRVEVSVIAARGNRILNICRERYLRDDVVCGVAECQACEQRAKAAAARVPACVAASSAGNARSVLSWTAPLLVFDVDALVHQQDLLAHEALRNVVLLHSQMQELSRRNAHAYSRAKTVSNDDTRRVSVFLDSHVRECVLEKRVGEPQREFRARQLLVAARWFVLHGQEAGARVRVVVHSEQSRAAVEADGVECVTATQLATEMQDSAPELLDLVVPEQADDERGDGAAQSGLLFDAHLPIAQIDVGVTEGRLLQGKLRLNRNNHTEGCVMPFASAAAARRMDSDEFVVAGVLVQGLAALNRATDGDVVAVRVLPRSEWRAESNLLLSTVDTEAAQESLAVGALENANAAAAAAADAGGDALERDAAPLPLDAEERAAMAEAARTETNVAPRATGVVVGVVRRAWKPLCGSLLPLLSAGGARAGRVTSALFVPADRRMPHVRIRTRQYSELAGQRIVVAIDRWPRTSRYPIGHYVRTIGRIGDAETDTEALLLQYDVPHHEFSAAVLECLPPMPWSLANEDQVSLRRRVDLREQRILSVDPPGCTDIDDALHCRRLENGNFEVGVHIADVTHFVRQDSALDREASERGTTVYLVDRRIDMLPGALSTDTCSLRANVDRLAFSCVWEMDSDAQVLSTHFHKSVIRSNAAYTYEQAQNLIDSGSETDGNAAALRQLNAFAKRLRAQRLANGALTLASTQVRFIRRQDESGDNAISDVELYEMRDTNRMVEEFMLLANVSVAEQLRRAYPQFAMLRRHPTPSAEQFHTLVEAAAQHGITINPDSSLSLARSLDEAKSQANPFFNKLLRILTTRCMTQALYFCSGTLSQDQYRHYGLAASIYTHFTSPIRRYADVVVHRLLAASIGWEPLPTSTSKQLVHNVADHINFRGRQAQQAARDSSKLFTIRFFLGRRVLADAYVSRVKANGFVVLVPRYGIEGIVHLAAKGDPHHFEYDAVHQRLRRPAAKSPLGEATIALFAKVRVCITVDDRRAHDMRLKLLCLSPPIGEGALLDERQVEQEERKRSADKVEQRHEQQQQQHDAAHSGGKAPKRRKQKKTRGEKRARHLPKRAAGARRGEPQSVTKLNVSLLDDGELSE